MSADRYPCSSCGAQLDWSPEQGTLECPYCGHEEENPGGGEPEPYVPVEHRLDDAAKTATRGWGHEVKQIQCDACGAISDMEPHIEASECAFCGSAQLQVQSGGGEDLIRPEGILPFQIAREKAIADFRGWISGLWFRPNALKRLAQMEGIRGVYLPSWTYDSQTHSHWTADAGYYYYEDETYTANEGGKSVTKTRKVRKTRWVPARGRHSKFFDDVLICASKGLEHQLFKGLFPYELQAMKSYDTQYLAGFTAERYQISLGDGYKTAQDEMSSVIRSECSRLVPGDTHRHLKVNTHFSQATFKHIVLPVWIAAYRYQEEVYQYIVNGQTGKTHGTAPYSMAKIVSAVLAVIAVIVAVVLLSQK